MESNFSLFLISVCYDFLMSRELTVKGVVVGRRIAGEESLRVHLYTDQLGLVSCVAKSARTERSKLRPHLLIGSFGVYSLVKGKDVWRVTGAWETDNVFYSRSRVQNEGSARVFQTVRQFVRGEGSDPYLFSVLWNFAHRTRNINDEDVRDAECLAALRILASLGYVEESQSVSEFLDASYESETLLRARSARQELVRSINAGIKASHL